MEANKELRIAGFVFAFLLVLMCFLMQQNTSAVQEQNDQLNEADSDRQTAEYQRVLLGCNTSGALESKDELLRELCDEYLPSLRNDLIGGD